MLAKSKSNIENKNITTVGNLIECNINDLDKFDQSLSSYDIIYGCFVTGYCSKGVVPFLKIINRHLKVKGIIVLKDGIITKKYREDT